MQEITQETTVRDAVSFLSSAQQINLRFWAGEFGIQIREFHMGHIKTYENLRLRIASFAPRRASTDFDQLLNSAMWWPYSSPHCNQMGALRLDQVKV